MKRVRNAAVSHTGNWTLTTDGQLTYTPVPLPAAVTLLPSGLGLLGILMQRRGAEIGVKMA